MLFAVNSRRMLGLIPILYGSVKFMKFSHKRRETKVLPLLVDHIKLKQSSVFRIAVMLKCHAQDYLSVSIVCISSAVLISNMVCY